MLNLPLPKLTQVLSLAVSALIVKVTIEVVYGYVNYFPPNFSSDFLHGREAYFASRYQWVFYPHIAFGPVSLFLGLVVISERLRMRFPRWHRWLGRVHVANVLLIVIPSGFVMAWDAAAGVSAMISFVLLSALTWGCTALGWQAAMQRRFVVHRQWMQRSFLLLCSAVVLRVFGGLGNALEVPWLWFDAVISWASWVLPLSLFEAHTWWNHRRRRGTASAVAPFLTEELRTN